MGVMRSSETSVRIQTKRRYIPEDGNIQFWNCFLRMTASDLDESDYGRISQYSPCDAEAIHKIKSKS
jgi:hypothetical protein